MTRFHLDAYGALEGVRSALASFFDSSFRLADPKLDRALHDTIARFGLLAPPVVEATFPYKEAKEAPRTVEELGTQGVFHPELWRILDAASGEARWPRSRPLYRHQVEAFQAYKAGQSLVVSSGTGSGKTECFLLPAIDAVLRDAALASPGVRVLVVYPLNALVNNQLERLRALLGHHPRIRFGLYTRRLPNTRKEAERRANRAGRPLLPAEVHSREELRSNPPHILITNYSMLEYALVRSADAPIFSSGFAKPKLVVLDEAHVYAGAMAAEITLLLRRAWLRWGLDVAPQGIVTSATMKQGITDGDAKLVAFASDLLSKPPKAVSLVVGERDEPAEVGEAVAVPIPPVATVADFVTDFPTLRDIAGAEGEQIVLADDADSRRAALAVATAVNPVAAADAAPTDPAALVLWKAFHALAWVRELRRKLRSGVVRVDALSADLFPEAEAQQAQRAVLRLLELLAVARTAVDQVPLLPVRLHGTARGPHGIFSCIRPNCGDASVPGRVGRLFADPTDCCSCGAFVAELRACEACGQAFLAMAEGIGDDGFPALRQQVRGSVDLFVVDKATWDDGSPLTGGTVTHVFGDGRVGGGSGSIALRKFGGGPVSGPTRRLVDVACPKCGEEPRSGRPIIRRIESGTTAVLQVLVDGLYPYLPEHRDKPNTLRGAGRRALLFADNRQVAASLAAQVEESHDIIAARRVILQSLHEAMKSTALPPAVQRLQSRFHAALAAGDTVAVQSLAQEMQAAAAAAGVRAVTYTDLQQAVARHHAIQELSGYSERVPTEAVAAFAVTRELARRPSRLGNLEANGLVAVDYGLDLRRPAEVEVDRAFPGSQWNELVGVVLDTIRTSGVVRIPSLPAELLEQFPSWLTGRLLQERTHAAGDDGEDDDDVRPERRKLVSLIAAPPGHNRRSAWVARVCNALGNSSVQPRMVLQEIWGSLWDASASQDSCLRRVTDQGYERLQIAVDMLRFYEPPANSLFTCPKCKTIWARQVAKVCPSVACTGILAPMAAPSPRDRLVSLSQAVGPILGLRTHEHTAQIGVDDLEVFERKFKAGKINLLVCSTTMELGVDIGGLSATVLTNVPPSASNYLQRAGRAGRRAEGTSLVLTFARPRPYDQAAFRNPNRPFLDKISPPQVKLDSPRIVQRHANAALLADFFRRAEAFSDEANPMAAFGEVAPFADQPLEKALPLQPAAVAALAKTLNIDASQSTLADAFIAWLAEVAPQDTTAVSAVEAIVDGTVLQQLGIFQICRKAQERLATILREVREQLRFLRSQLAEEMDRSPESRDRERVKAIEIAVADLAREKLLAYLAEQQFLPRYGFPINVCRLHETWEKREHDDGLAAESEDDQHLQLRLERDITVALSEYAPGADVVAGKYVHTSRGLVRHWTGGDVAGTLPTGALGVCSSCGRLQQGRNEGGIALTCPTCGEEGVRIVSFVRPTGFAVQWGTRPRRWIGGGQVPIRPVTEAAYAAKDDVAVQVSDKLGLAYDEEGEILVRSEGALAANDLLGDSEGSAGGRRGLGYAICYVCGRAEPEVHERKARPVPLPPAIVEHQRLRGGKICTPTDRYWRHVALAGAVRTETLRLVVEPFGALGMSPNARMLATTMMVAMQLAAGEVLGVDSREIASLLSPRHTPSGAVFDVVLYDTRAGGSGHCRALLDRWAELLKAVRGRLDCSNAYCTQACPNCLLAFETQRHLDLLNRAALSQFLEDQWEALERRIVRDGIPVARLHRGAMELGEAVAGAGEARVTVIAPSLARDAFDEAGWLRRITRSAAPGSLRLVIGRAPDPNDDTERFLAERLSIAIEGREMEVLVAKPDAVAAVPWRIAIGSEFVFHVEGAEADALGPKWLEAATIHCATNKSTAAVESVERLVVAARTVSLPSLKAAPMPPTTVIHNVAKNLRGDNATFARWFRGPDGKSLFARPLRALSITDPYLGTKWQMSLLRELVELAQAAQCGDITVITYEPKADADRPVSLTEQQERVARLINKPGWKPLPPAFRSVDRIHKRVVKGERVDGTKFEVLLERGLDFIVENIFHGRTERVTRESYLVVRDPC
jgi:DEAD/DEAH box helicase/Helicase conserved C-terminal domain/Domain of unknown function (DUF1998)